MNAPDFAAASADIRAIEAERLESEHSMLRRWAADVERADAAATNLSSDGHFAVQAIKALGVPTDDECVALFAALFRALDKNSHVTRNRDAMACLSDMVADFSTEHEVEEDDGDTDRYQDARRDDERDVV